MTKKRRKLKKKYKRRLIIIILIVVLVSGLIAFIILQSQTNSSTDNIGSIEQSSEFQTTSNDNNGIISDTKDEKVEESAEKENLEYPEDAYTDGVLDPKKLKPKEALNQDNDLILVNKQYVLDENYAPEVVEIEGNYLRDYVANTYLEMKEDAQEEGVSLQIGSAYRSYSYQEEVFNSYLAIDPYETVITYSAYPGTSEHQTGLVIDFAEGGSCDYTECFETTSSGAWLKDNAYKYGFILRYPKGKDDVTGYMYEPWHYRYVGEDAAKYIYDNDLTLEEYVLVEKGGQNA